MPAPSEDIQSASLARMRDELIRLRRAMLEFERRHTDTIAPVAREHTASARNLLHYLALRREDLRTLQTQLATFGLSSIGRSESHALASVQAVIDVLNRALREHSSDTDVDLPCDLISGTTELEEHSVRLLGSAPSDRSVRIMITMPSEAARDYTIVHDLLDSGMDCMRINCAHDDADAWLKMIEHLSQARAALNRQCSVLMDLGGPKLRTGRVEPGPAVLKLRPQRDVFGRVIAPARVWLTANRRSRSAPSAADGILHVDREWLTPLRSGDKVRFRDTREHRRTLKVVDATASGCWAELTHTAYVTNGTVLKRRAKNDKDDHKSSTVSGIETRAGKISLRSGDLLILTADGRDGREASYDSAGNLLTPASISCSLPEVFADIKAGERIYLDDGAIGGTVQSVSAEEIRVHVDHTPPRGARLRADKGINFPESALTLPALTSKDIEDLQFAVRHADMIGLSFANHESDVRALLEQLHAYDAPLPGVVLKIETRRGFEHLPAMLLTAMRHPRFGVMIARGDLAVECGYERMAEVQEEILWMCEAAHCPVIWATQVLESLAKEGTPSRAEISDAAMGNRAECVMLNKGPYINEAAVALDDILRRMAAHQSKKRAMLRALHVATIFDGVDELPSESSRSAAREVTRLQ